MDGSFFVGQNQGSRSLSARANEFQEFLQDKFEQSNRAELDLLFSQLNESAKDTRLRDESGLSNAEADAAASQKAADNHTGDFLKDKAKDKILDAVFGWVKEVYEAIRDYLKEGKEKKDRAQSDKQKVQQAQEKYRELKERREKESKQQSGDRAGQKAETPSQRERPAKESSHRFDRTP